MIQFVRAECLGSTVLSELLETERPRSSASYVTRMSVDIRRVYPRHDSDNTEPFSA